MNEYEVRVTDQAACKYGYGIAAQCQRLQIYSSNHTKLNTRNEKSRYVELFHVSAFFVSSIR